MYAVFHEVAVGCLPLRDTSFCELAHVYRRGWDVAMKLLRECRRLIIHEPVVIDRYNNEDRPSVSRIDQYCQLGGK